MALNLQYFDWEKAFKGADDQVKADQYLIDQEQKQARNNVLIDTEALKLDELQRTQGDRLGEAQARSRYNTDYFGQEGAVRGVSQPGRLATAGTNSAFQEALAGGIDPKAVAALANRQRLLDAENKFAASNLFGIKTGTALNNAPITNALDRIQLEGKLGRAPGQEALAGAVLQDSLALHPQRIAVEKAKLVRDLDEVQRSTGVPSEKETSAQLASIIGTLYDTLADPKQLEDELKKTGAEPTPENIAAFRENLMKELTLRKEQFELHKKGFINRGKPGAAAATVPGCNPLTGVGCPPTSTVPTPAAPTRSSSTPTRSSSTPASKSAYDVPSLFPPGVSTPSLGISP